MLNHHQSRKPRSPAHLPASTVAVPVAVPTGPRRARPPGVDTPPAPERTSMKFNGVGDSSLQTSFLVDDTAITVS